MPAGSRSVVGHWHTVTLAVTNNTATGWIGSVRVFGNVSLTSTPVPAPRLAPPVRIPPSGWAGIAATIGRSQVDNFKLVGTAGGGAAVPPCGSAAPATGSPVVSTPCDYPGTVAGWTVVPGSGVIQLGLRRSIQANARPPLCLGAPPAKTSGHAGSAGAAVALVTCDSPLAVVYDVATGRISPRGNGSQCVTTVQRTALDPAAVAVVLGACVPIPSESQQFQYHPGTGALRPKASSCIASSHGESTPPQYRDCCLAMCAHSGV